MAIAYRSTTAAAGTTEFTITKPTGTVDDDILIMVVGMNQTTDLGSLPAGWERFAQTLNTNSAGFLAWKRASSEGASYNVTGFSGIVRAGLMAFSGCTDVGTPLEASAGRANSTTTRGTDGITTTVTGAAIISAAVVTANVDVSLWTATDPATLTERLSTGQTGLSVSAASDVQSVAGPTGATSYSHSNNENTGFVCSLSPVPLSQGPDIMAFGPRNMVGTLRGAFRGL